MTWTPEEKALAHAASRQLPWAKACEICGRKQHVVSSGAAGVVWHHWSYAEEHRTDCIPLCRRCHSRVHAGLIPEPRTGRIYGEPRQARQVVTPAQLFVSPPPDHTERQRIVLDRFPHGVHRSARDIAKVLGWGLGTVHATLRELRLAGIVDAPNPSLGFIRLRDAA